MADDVLWVLSADGEEAITTFDDIDAAVQAMGDSVDAVSSAMDEQFAALTAAMDELSQMTQANAEAAGMLGDSMATASDSMASFGEAVSSDASELDNLNMIFASLNTTISDDAEYIDNLVTRVVELQDQLATLQLNASGATEATAALGDAEAATAAESSALGDALSSALGPLTMILTAVGMVGGAFLKMGMDGQKGESLLSGMAGASQQDIAALQQEAIKLGVSMDQASAGFYQVASAGFTGRDGILVFDNAMKLAEGGQARASDIMSALTGIMHAYGYTASQSGQVTDLMAEAILRGKQSAQDFASSIGPLAAAGKNVGFSFAEVTAAEATMTQINPHVMQDAQQLKFLFNATSLSIDSVAASAKKLKVPFDEAHYKSMDLIGRLQYLAEVSGGTSTVAFKKLVGGSAGLSAALALLSGHGKAFSDNMAAMSHSAGATEGAFQSWEGTVSSHLDKVGAAFSVFATRFMDAIGPKIIPIIDQVSGAVGQFADFFSSHIDQMMPVIIGVAAAIGGALVVALVALLATAGPVILGVLAFGAAVAGVAALVQAHADMISTAFGKMDRDAEMHTLNMKLQATQNTLDMANQNIAHIHRQEQIITEEIQRTRDAHTRAMLEMKLRALEASDQQAQGVIRNTQKEREGIQAQLDQLNPAVHLRNLQRKDDSIGMQIEETQRTIAGYGQMKAGIEQQLAQTTNAVKRHALEAQLAAIEHAQKQKEGVLRQLEGQRKGIETQMKGIQQQMSAEQANPILRLIGAFQQLGAAIQNGWGAAMRVVLPILQQMGAYVAAQFVPLWAQLVQVWRTQLQPALAQLWEAIQSLMPIFQAVGGLIAGLFVTSLGLAFASLSGFIHALGTFISGVITWIGGFVRFFTGMVQIFSGIVMFIVDLTTGHFDKLKADLGRIWQGIINVFSGGWQMIQGIFQMTIGTIISFVQGFIDGLIGFFTHLWDALVGHSIIPDMINGIIQWFSQLPSRAMTFVSQLVSQITGALGSLGSKALGWAGDMISGFVHGIQNGIGAVGNAISGVADKVRQFLHFSKPDTGPLADADQYMRDMIDMMAQGLTNNQHKLKQAVSGVASSLSQGLTPNINVSGASGPGGTSFGTSATTALLGQILGTLQQQGRGSPSATGPTNITMNNTNSFSGVSNIQQLYNLLNGLAGQAFESGARGAF